MNIKKGKTFLNSTNRCKIKWNAYVSFFTLNTSLDSQTSVLLYTILYILLAPTISQSKIPKTLFIQGNAWTSKKKKKVSMKNRLFSKTEKTYDWLHSVHINCKYRWKQAENGVYYKLGHNNLERKQQSQILPSLGYESCRENFLYNLKPINMFLPPSNSRSMFKGKFLQMF